MLVEDVTAPICIVCSRNGGDVEAVEFPDHLVMVFNTELKWMKRRLVKLSVIPGPFGLIGKLIGVQRWFDNWTDDVRYQFFLNIEVSSD